MHVYQNVIVAIDLADDCTAVVEKTVDLGIDFANLRLVHVFEPIPAPYASVIPYAPGLAATDDLDNRVRSNLAGKLHSVADQFNIPSEQCLLLEGYPAKEIRTYAADSNADLILIGSHGRHGLGLVLGSTVNAVLHGAPCDVLAVRIGI